MLRHALHNATRDMSQDLRQADLSDLTLKQMSSEQRTELRRRFETFIKAFAPAPTMEAEPPKKVRKWVPGMKD